MAFRLHLESRRAQSPSFHLDDDAWAKAAARHPELAGLVDVSFGWDGEDLAAALATADALLASKFDKRLANDAPRLRWIHTTGAGVDHLLPVSDFRADLILTNSSGIHSDKAGESALMALLMLNARMPEVIENQRQHVWQSIMTTSIRDKNTVVIGFGDIGQAVGKVAHGAGMRVTAVTRSGKPGALAPDIPVVTLSQLDALLPTADFIVVTAPLTPETHNVLDARRLELLHPTAGIVNMARAALVDYEALAGLLRAGSLGGAVLDVFDGEPLTPESIFWDVPRLVVLPHMTCDSPDYNQRVLDLWFRNFALLQAGQPFINQVDRLRGY